MIQDIPLPLLELAKNQEKVLEWWRGLSEKQQQELAESYSADSYPKNCVAYRTPATEEEFETMVDGVFVNDQYEYLVNHELLFKPVRTFHICTAHKEARAIQIDGFLPPDFICPLNHTNDPCPMKRILAESPDQGFLLTQKLKQNR